MKQTYLALNASSLSFLLLSGKQQASKPIGIHEVLVGKQSAIIVKYGITASGGYPLCKAFV